MVGKEEARRLEGYLGRMMRGEVEVRLREGVTDGEDSVEVYADGEFVGLAYRDEDEGEASYAFTMTVLVSDLE